MTDLRRLALGWALPGGPGLGRLLARHLPHGTVWIATGHANLEPEVFDAVAALPGGRSAVLIHDTIPLDHPEFSRPAPAAAFARRLATVSARADLAIYNSAATRRAAEARLAGFGRIPPGVVAPLGVTVAAPDPAALPPLRDGALFTILGTVEPRKNHALLLDVWEGFARDLPAGGSPVLAIAGARGWRIEGLVERLEASPLTGRQVLELPGLSDGAVVALLQRSHGLLMPSLAEGFGLPAAEAAALGVPVICSDLPVFHEVLGDYPTYAATDDRAAWARAILGLARRALPQTRQPPLSLPPWESHISLVLNRL